MIPWPTHEKWDLRHTGVSHSIPNWFEIYHDGCIKATIIFTPCIDPPCLECGTIIPKEFKEKIDQYMSIKRLLALPDIKL